MTDADEDAMTERAASSPPLWLQDQWDAADIRASRWRTLGFVVAAALWMFPSLFVWLLFVSSLAGGPIDSSPPDGLLDGGTLAFGTLAFSVILEATAAGGLVGIARWAFRTWRVAWVFGLAATVWAQLLVSAWVLL